MFDWDDIRVCLAVQRARTFAQAGALLGLNATTVARRLSALEETLGAKLFERRPEGCVPTEMCLRLVERAERMEQEMLALSRDLAGGDQRLEGKVRITASEMMATRFIAPHLGRFRARCPALELELLVTSERLDLARREADIALRLSRPVEDQLVIKRLASIDLGLYAARRYVDEHGLPETFAGHQAIFFADVRGFARENAWLEHTLEGARVTLRSDSVSSVYGACVAGTGIALLPRIVADRDGRLLRIREQGPEPRFIWQAVHQDLAQAARIRAVTAFLAEIFEPAA